MTLIAVIPARSGSKRIKNKNLKHFKGKPLIQWTIEAALNSKYIDKVIVSTDSREIADVSKRLGATIPYLRPKNFALDNSPTIDLVLDFLEKDNSITQFLLLQPTSPLRKVSDVKNSIKLLIKKNYDSLWTVSKTDSKFHPEKQLLIKNNKIKYYSSKGSRIIYRQQLSQVYHRNSNAYIVKINFLKKKKILLSKNTGYYLVQSKQISIDSLEDMKIASKFF